jgi:hypothetical protein
MNDATTLSKRDVTKNMKKKTSRMQTAAQLQSKVGQEQIEQHDCADKLRITAGMNKTLKPSSKSKTSLKEEKRRKKNLLNKREPKCDSSTAAGMKCSREATVLSSIASIASIGPLDDAEEVGFVLATNTTERQGDKANKNEGLIMKNMRRQCV